MVDTQPQWTEEDSQLYRQIAPVAVPARAGQIATLLTLIPFGRQDTFSVVEIGSGEGILSTALLTCYPKATLTALDGSEEMRAATQWRLAEFGPRGQVEPFELISSNWYHRLQNADCILSSLCLHHLSGKEKRNLFEIIHSRLSTNGALLIADLVAPQRSEAQEMFAATWDYHTKAQAISKTGSADLFEKFRQAEWNLYRYPDPVDKPSPLFEQLIWLKEAGFSNVDCFWMQAGHAIYGGYKSATASVEERLSFETALGVVEGLLG